MNTQNIINILKEKQTKKKALDKEILHLLQQLSEEDPTGDKYKATLERIEKLSKLRKDERRIKDIDVGQIFQVVGNFAAVWSILNYEKAEVVTSKAFGVFMRGVK